MPCRDRVRVIANSVYRITFLDYEETDKVPFQFIIFYEISARMSRLKKNYFNHMFKKFIFA